MVWDVKCGPDGDMENTKRDYGEACGVFASKVKGDDQWDTFALGRKNDGFPWMQFLFDVYSRENLNDKGGSLEFADWFAGLCTIKNVPQAQRSLIESAGKDYDRNLFPQISTVRWTTVIDDALEPIIAHLVMANALVQCAAHCGPFQFELVIACDTVTKPYHNPISRQ